MLQGPTLLWLNYIEFWKNDPYRTFYTVITSFCEKYTSTYLLLSTQSPERNSNSYLSLMHTTKGPQWKQRNFSCQNISLPKGYLDIIYYLSATKTVATGGYWRDIAPILCILELLVISRCLQTLLRRNFKKCSEQTVLHYYMMLSGKFH